MTPMDEGKIDEHFKKFSKIFGGLIVIGTIKYINQKEGTKGPYVTVGLEDGAETGDMPLIVRSKTLVDQLVEGNTYDFTTEKSGIWINVTDLKLTDGEAPKPGDTPKPGSYKSDYQKRKHPVEQALITMQAFSKSLITAYGTVWAANPKLFADLDALNVAVREAVGGYMAWAAETIEGIEG